MTNSSLTLAYDYDKWYDWGIREAISIELSPSVNNHTLICGMSGSGKSFCVNTLFAKLARVDGKVDTKSEIYFADYKQDDSFSHLRGAARYYPYKESFKALDVVYEKLHKRQTNEDKERHPITLIWDEYIAAILSLQNEDKKAAALAMNKVSEILMLGRSLSTRVVICCQRPDASAFPSGSRLNYGIIMILGAPIRSIYEMLIPAEYIDKIGDREFKIGEGILLLQGSLLRFIKVPVVSNVDKMRELCVKALS